MALLEFSRPDPVVPRKVKERIDRGRKAMLKDAPKRRLCMRFTKGDTYWYITERNNLNFQSTVTHVTGGGKPPHRIRNTYNLIGPIIRAKVSAATQRIPSYEVTPSTTDPQDIAAARLSEKVALYGYDKWGLRRVSKKVVKLAAGGGGDGFAMPYFEPNVGPYVQIDTEDGPKQVGYGEIRVLILNGNECYWEPGVDFMDSRWYVIERATPLDDIREIPGFTGIELKADAGTSDIPTDKDKDNLAMLTRYMERPCPEYPQGRHLYIANGQVVAPEDTYPLIDPQNRVLDEPVLHRLCWDADPETDRDFGLTWQLIDAQRTYQDCWNKILEWKNRCLHPQMKAVAQSLLNRPTDVPGAVTYYKAGFAPPEWEKPPQIPAELFQILREIQQFARDVAADEQIEAQADVAAKTIQAVIEQSNLRWQEFLGDLAEFHSRLARHCLMLVQRHYQEPRLLAIQGTSGPYLIPDFQGAQLLDQVDVRVFPQSLEVRTKQQITNQVLAFADRGWVTPMQAMAAINGGTAEKLIESYELDIARINRVIQKIRDQTVLDMPAREEPDPMTGEPMQVPSYMPSEVDNLEVWRNVLGDWMKTHEYDELDPGLQEVAKQIWRGIQFLEAQQQMRMLEAQNAQAAEQGMENAARPVREKPLPDQRQPDG